MAVTINCIEVAEGIGNAKFAYGTITFDSSYPTGGETVAISLPQALERIDALVAQAAGYSLAWDPTNQKLKAHRDKDPASTGGADAAFPEVANTTDLSAVTATFIAVGQ